MSAWRAAEKFINTNPNRPPVDDYEQHLSDRGRLTPAVQESLEKARAARHGHDVVFYIAGALTGVDEQTKQRYALTSELIGRHDRPEASMFGYAPHLHGTDPVKHPAVSPQEVRDIDYLWASVTPDCHINFLDPVAHGNAIEAGWAETYSIPSLHLVPEGMTTSRLVRGLENTVGTLVYSEFEKDGLAQIEEFLHRSEMLTAERKGTPIEYAWDVGPQF